MVAEKSQEQNRHALDRLKTKVKVVQNVITSKNKEELSELEKENKRLQGEVSKFKIGIKIIYFKLNLFVMKK
jgi:hypothetical protein